MTARDLKGGIPQNATCWRHGGGEVCERLKVAPPFKESKLPQFRTEHMHMIDIDCASLFLWSIFKYTLQSFIWAIHW